jgi:hypothetical protein
MKEQEDFTQTEAEVRFLMTGYRKVLKHRFPELVSSFSRLPDPRSAQGKQYGLNEVMMGGLSLFLFKAGSRNQHNNNRRSGYFSAHYHQLFGDRKSVV